MSDSVRAQRRQPTRLPHPWDSPGKNTGVGCHFLLQCMKVKVKSLNRVRLLATHGLQPTRLLRPQDFPGKSTGVGCHCLLQIYELVLWKKIINIKYNLCSCNMMYRHTHTYNKLIELIV